MSYSTALGVTPGERPVELAEFRNAWGWAPSIWRRLLRHHGFDEHWREVSDLDRLWRGIERAPDWERVALVLTADTGVIESANYDWAAACLDEFEKRLPAPPGHANHVPAVAALLRTRPDAPMFGMWCTSVTDNPFNPWDEKKDAPGHGLRLDELQVLARRS